MLPLTADQGAQERSGLPILSDNESVDWIQQSTVA